jgi:hypothetical protein
MRNECDLIHAIENEPPLQMDSMSNFSIDSAEVVRDNINFLKQVLTCGLGKLRNGLSWKETTFFFRFLDPALVDGPS